jgi:predicted house-cleaning noncanonical NTP pyrophosphatase (MazG superfamily)
MEGQPGEMTRQEIIDEVAFALLDEVEEYFDTYHGKLEPRLLEMILNLVAANMVNQYEFDAKRWGKVASAVAVE